MKYLSVILSALLIFLTTEVAHAQHGQQHADQHAPGMMQGMHQQMMQDPLHHYNMMAFALPALADTLELGQQQQARLEELRSEMIRLRESQREQMAPHHNELTDLFDAEGEPSPDEVRAHLTAMAQMRAEHQMALYETARAMHDVLTDQQRQMLEAMDPEQRMHHMMRHMTMAEMMEMMQAMHGPMMMGMRPHSPEH